MVLEEAEAAEALLSYVSPCGSELARKQSGSYYTPIDVSRFFWNEFFRLRDIENIASAQKFLNAHTFIEPAVGAGALFFALIEKLLKIGVNISDVSGIRAHLVDLNADALEFVKAQISELEGQGGVDFKNINYLHSDFLLCSFEGLQSPLMVFGNPPFVPNKAGGSKWKNSYADFLEKAISLTDAIGSVHFIVPMSIAFSRDYRDLRNMMLSERRAVVLSNFDNIPDTLFKSGKPKHSNTNKANSQRCTILTSMPSIKKTILSSSLNRWSKRRRDDFLSTPIIYTDVTDYEFDDQIPRPQNEKVLNYIQKSRKDFSTIANHIVYDGHYALHVSGVARNYIGLREVNGSNTNSLYFSNEKNFLRVLRVITSDLFFDYWLTTGDGFHVTRSNILNFPIHAQLLSEIDSSLKSTSRMWRERKCFVKIKINSGVETLSYDFSSASTSLYYLD